MRPEKLAGASWVGWYMPRETGGALAQLDDICLEKLVGAVQLAGICLEKLMDPVRLVGILKNRSGWLVGWWARLAAFILVIIW